MLRYQYSRNNPWTRDGQVRAAVIQVTPNVSGQVVNVGVKDNQLVEQGTLLFEIDPRPFEARLEQARANLAGVSAGVDEARASLGEVGDANPSIRAARAALREAQLNVEFTRITAPANGYVTNLNLRVGSHAVANQPALALVDVDSFWIEGFFRETAIAHISPGDRAVVTLMGYPGRPIEGRVESIGWGIAQPDGATGRDLLPQIRPTFEWIRLAQRIPVKIALGELPDGVLLRVGTSASVQVLGGTAPPAE
nr:HlyD family secretion protein [Microbulbifer salipaludis]